MAEFIERELNKAILILFKMLEEEAYLALMDFTTEKDINILFRKISIFYGFQAFSVKRSAGRF